MKSVMFAAQNLMCGQQVGSPQCEIYNIWLIATIFIVLPYIWFLQVYRLRIVWVNVNIWIFSSF